MIRVAEGRLCWGWWGNITCVQRWAVMKVSMGKSVYVITFCRERLCKTIAAHYSVEGHMQSGSLWMHLVQSHCVLA